MFSAPNPSRRTCAHAALALLTLSILLVTTAGAHAAYTPHASDRTVSFVIGA